MADYCPNFLETIKERFRNDRGKLCTWLTSPNYLLEKNAPGQMIMIGRNGDLILVEQALDVDYPPTE
jgi:hypothetical protein